MSMKYKGNLNIQHYKTIVESVLTHFPRLVTKTGVEVKLFDTYIENSQEKQSSACLKYPTLKDGCTGTKIGDYTFIIHIFIPGTHPRNKSMGFQVPRYAPIIDAIGAPLDDESLFLCILLHELGHCEYIRQFYTVGKTLDHYDELCKTNENKIYELFAGQERSISDYGMSYLYLLSDELFCDYFVYRNFPSVWKELKNCNLLFSSI